jgi:hypothetical protein
VWLDNVSIVSPNQFVLSVNTLNQVGGWAENVKYVEGDFNHDGYSDIAALWQNGIYTAISPFVNNQSGAFLAGAVTRYIGGWSDSMKFVGGDFNNDGYPDIAAMRNNGGTTSAAFFKNNKNNTFTGENWSINAYHLTSWTDNAKFVSGKFDNDSAFDVCRLYQKPNTGYAAVDTFLAR